MMDMIGKDDFDNVEKLPELDKKEDSIIVMDEPGFQELLIKMQNPVEAQKELAVQIKQFLDQQIKKEMETKGYLSDFVRRWVSDYNTILEKLQKSLYGDKSVNLHMHKITHSQIAAKIRKVTEEENIKDEKPKTDN